MLMALTVAAVICGYLVSIGLVREVACLADEWISSTRSSSMRAELSEELWVFAAFWPVTVPPIVAIALLYYPGIFAGKIITLIPRWLERRRNVVKLPRAKVEVR